MRLRGRHDSTDGIASAQRLHRPRWGDTRLWFGLALIVVAMVAGARLLSSSQDRVTVWRATADLAPGTAPQVEPVRVALGSLSDAYAGSDVPPSGRMLLPVPAGALVPLAAIGAETASPERLMTLPVDPLHAPVGLAVGDVVDVWSTTLVSGQPSGAPVRVLPGVRVAAVAVDQAGVGGELPVVLRVAPDDVVALVTATRNGVIDLVQVPIDQVQS